MPGMYGMGGGPSVGGGGPGGMEDLQRQQALFQQQQQEQALAAAQQGQAQQQQGQGGGGGFGEQLAGAFDNPGIAAALGAGGSILSAAESGGSIGDAIRAGLAGGGAGFVGATQKRKKQKSDERQRKLLLDAITRGYGGIVEDGQLPNLSIYQAMLGLDR